MLRTKNLSSEGFAVKTGSLAQQCAKQPCQSIAGGINEELKHVTSSNCNQANWKGPATLSS